MALAMVFSSLLQADAGPCLLACLCGYVGRGQCTQKSKKQSQPSDTFFSWGFVSCHSEDF